jgi:hypothetical protein
LGDFGTLAEGKAGKALPPFSEIRTMTAYHFSGLVALTALAALPVQAQTSAMPDASANDAVVAEQAEVPAAPADPLRFELGEGSLKLAIEAGLQFVAQKNAYWNLSDTLAPTADFDTDPTWGEGYIEAGLTYERPLGNATIRIGASGVAAQSLGRDVFNEEDRGRLVLEDAFAELRIAFGEGGDGLTLSGGAQSFKLGNGMLIGDGGVDGFERGALIFGPRSAWENTAIGKLEVGGVTARAFHLNPRELDSGDTRTLINGGALETKLGATGTAGIAYLHVPRSEAPYIQAAPGGNGVPAFIFNGRDGLSSVQAWFKASPIASLPGFYVAGDYARQRNGRIDLEAWGGRIEIGNTFVKSSWMPTLSYSFQTFSGDDPDTPELERFDPMFYDGAQTGWATGTNGSFVFINSNVRAHRLSLVMLPSQRDIVTLRAVTIEANELRSPLQFGQATRPNLDPNGPGLVSGVTRRHLSNDVLAEYTRVLNQNLFATVVLGHSWAGDGLRSVVPDVDDWTGILVNLVAKY